MGSDRGWKDKSEIKVIEDITVSGLRIRVTQPTNNTTCAEGNYTSIELNGPINKDTSFALKKILQQLPPCISKDKGRRVVPTIYLNSGGGTLEDGYTIGILLRKEGASTVVTGKQVCASACAVAFLGGTFRSVEHDGRLVFHAPYREDKYGLITCAKSHETSAKMLHSYYVSMIDSSADRLFERTMDYCSRADGWTLDAGAAKLFGILK